MILWNYNKEYSKFVYHVAWQSLMLSSILGPEIPIECVDGSMVTSPNGEGAIMLGCSTNPEKIHIMKWNGYSLQWTLMKQTLKYPKYYTVAMLIPKELTSCIL